MPGGPGMTVKGGGAAGEAGPSERIWQVVAAIPAGRVATYGDVARLAGVPRGARRVGAVLRGLPAATRLPWHRVLNARGCLSLPPDSAAGRRQRRRLEEEGVVFDRRDRIDLARYRWRGETSA